MPGNGLGARPTEYEHGQARKNTHGRSDAQQVPELTDTDIHDRPFNWPRHFNLAGVGSLKTSTRPTAAILSTGICAQITFSIKRHPLRPPCGRPGTRPRSRAPSGWVSRGARGPRGRPWAADHADHIPHPTGQPFLYELTVGQQIGDAAEFGAEGCSIGRAEDLGDLAAHAGGESLVCQEVGFGGEEVAGEDRDASRPALCRARS